MKALFSGTEAFLTKTKRCFSFVNNEGAQSSKMFLSLQIEWVNCLLRKVLLLFKDMRVTKILCTWESYMFRLNDSILWFCQIHDVWNFSSMRRKYAISFLHFVLVKVIFTYKIDYHLLLKVSKIHLGFLQNMIWETVFCLLFYGYPRKGSWSLSHVSCPL